MITKSSLVSEWVTSGYETVNTGTSDGALSSSRISQCWTSSQIQQVSMRQLVCAHTVGEVCSFLLLQLAPWTTS